ncbi:hypothetical protein C8R45DRAFT_933769 [Mycena sanguinolenta]|nr:hypothetical protein C8R45DRAFT_933769 [Mycena sanguinolenta]
MTSSAAEGAHGGYRTGHADRDRQQPRRRNPKALRELRKYVGCPPRPNALPPTQPHHERRRWGAPPQIQEQSTSNIEIAVAGHPDVRVRTSANRLEDGNADEETEELARSELLSVRGVSEDRKGLKGKRDARPQGRRKKLCSAFYGMQLLTDIFARCSAYAERSSQCIYQVRVSSSPFELGIVQLGMRSSGTIDADKGGQNVGINVDCGRTIVEKKKKDSAPNASYCFARFSLISGPIYLTPDAFEKRLRGACEWYPDRMGHISANTAPVCTVLDSFERQYRAEWFSPQIC